MTSNSSREKLATEPATSSGLSLWPGLIFVLLGSQIILMLIMVFKATTDRSFSVEPDYYQKALHWDETTAERRESERLGWAANIAIGDEADIFRNRNVTLLLSDRNGVPINGATVKLVAFSHARGSERTSITLDPAGGGQYHSQLRVTRPGLWEFRIAASRGAKVFMQTQSVVVPSAEGVR